MSDTATLPTQRKRQHAAIDALLNEIGLTVDFTFVPFSRSRNKDEKYPSLNYKCSVKLKGREILKDQDYMMGSGHCQSDKFKFGSDRYLKQQTIREECETGRPPRHIGWTRLPMGKSLGPTKPEPRDLFYSLIMDCNVIDQSGFSDWCSNLGFNDDSIKHREIYDSCVETSLKLVNSIGRQNFERLQNAYQDF
jgi:hypothetical protein